MDVLEVEALVEAVLARNPTLDVMEKARVAAAARREQAASLGDPMLTYGVAPESLSSSRVNDGHEVELSQAFPWPGKLRLRGRAAEHESYAAAHDVQTARIQLIRETRRSYYEYYFVDRAEEINAATLELMRVFQRIAEGKYAAGIVPKQDVLQAEVERLHLEHEAITLKRMRRVTQATINTLLHRLPGEDLPPPPTSVPATQAPPDLGALRERAINARPELQALAQRLEATRVQRQLAAKEYRPDFTVMASYNSMLDDPEHRWMVGAGINLPIQLDRRRAAELEALSETQRVGAELIAGVDRVGFEVSDAYELVVENVRITRLYEERILLAARQNLQAARAGYESGEADFLTFLTAERDLWKIELAYQRSLADYHNAVADLEHAVGGRLDEERSP